MLNRLQPDLAVSERHKVKGTKQLHKQLKSSHGEQLDVYNCEANVSWTMKFLCNTINHQHDYYT